MNKKHTVVYLAGPYSVGPLTPEQNTWESIKVQAKLFKAGWYVVNPLANSHFADTEHRLEPDFYYSMDLEILRRCDAIVMMPGWERSSGAKREKALAEKLGLPVYHWDTDCDMLCSI